MRRLPAAERAEVTEGRLVVVVSIPTVQCIVIQCCDIDGRVRGGIVHTQTVYAGGKCIVVIKE